MSTDQQSPEDERDQRDQTREFAFYWAGGCPRCQEPGVLRYVLVPRDDNRSHGAVTNQIAAAGFAVRPMWPVCCVDIGTCSVCRTYWEWGENNSNWKPDYMQDPEGAQARSDAFKAKLATWTEVTSDAAAAVWAAHGNAAG